jgi:integrase/recombinase XerD
MMLSNLKDFLNYIEFEKGYSKNTLETYGRYIRKFISYLDGVKIKHLSSVTQDHFFQFIGSLKQSGLEANSIRLILEACKTFFRFLKREEIVFLNPLITIEAPKVWKKFQTLLLQTDIEQYAFSIR